MSRVDDATIWAAFEQVRTKRATARELGISYRQVDQSIRRMKGPGGDGSSLDPIGTESPDTTPSTAFKTIEAGDSRAVEYTSDRRIRTLEDALAYAEVDTKTWRVHKWECGSYEVTLKARQGKDADGNHLPDRVVRKTMWRVRLDLRRILAKPYHDALEAIFADAAARAPAYPAIPAAPPADDPHMLEVDIFDAHFGKLAWEPETGQNYDLKIAERVYRNAVEDLVAMARGFAIDRVVLPIGNDFYNIDGLDNATTNGTPQDTDGRYAKIIEAGERAVIRAVEYLMAVAPVHVLWVPGNHDRVASYHLARVVGAWFRNTDRVTVDHGPRVRKYVRYGCNLIGYTHGNEEKHAALPVIMATEMPRDWAETTNREWHLGHEHRSKQTSHVSVNSLNGVEVKTLKSLSGTDAWHYRRGFVGTQRAAECQVLSFRNGQAGHFVANVRE